MEFSAVDDGHLHDTLRTIIENIPDAVAISDTNARFTVYNRAAAKLLNIEAVPDSPESCATRHGVFLADGVTPCPTESLPLLQALRGVSTTGTVLAIRNTLNPDGAYVSSNARPLRGPDGEITGAILVCHDVSALRLADEERSRTLASLQFLSEASALLGASLDYRDSLARLAELAVSGFADVCSCGLLEKDVIEVVARGIKGRGLVADPAVQYRVSELPHDHPVAVCLRTAGPTAIAGVASDPDRATSVAVSSAQLELLRGLGVNSYVLAPIATQARVFGILSFGFRDSESGRREAEALAFAVEAGRRVGAAIEKSLLHQAVSVSEARYRVLSETLPQLDHARARRAREHRTPLPGRAASPASRARRAG